MRSWRRTRRGDGWEEIRFILPDPRAPKTLFDFFPKSLNSNKSERNAIVKILGYCGILAPDAHPGFNQQFIHSVDWSYPARANCDMNYPARWWRAEDGLNRDALAEYFGDFCTRVC